MHMHSIRAHTHACTHTCTHLCLTLEIFSYLPGREKSHLDKPVRTARHKVLTIRRELGAFDVRFGRKSDRLAQPRGVAFDFKVPHLGPLPGEKYWGRA